MVKALVNIDDLRPFDAEELPPLGSPDPPDAEEILRYIACWARWIGTNINHAHSEAQIMERLRRIMWDTVHDAGAARAPQLLQYDFYHDWLAAETVLEQVQKELRSDEISRMFGLSLAVHNRLEQLFGRRDECW